MTIRGSGITDRSWLLVAKDGEYRLTGYATETERRNHERHGWRVVEVWQVKPTMDAVRMSAYIDAILQPTI